MHGGEGKVEDVTLRYYTSPEKQEYVQPVYYFDCNGPGGKFYGVVPAIKDEYLKPRETKAATRTQTKKVQQEPEGMLVKCRNPKCGKSYITSRQDYFQGRQEYLGKHPGATEIPGMRCERCWQDTAYEAVKCEKCGEVFEKVEKANDVYDRCPKCGYSKIEAVKSSESAK